MFNWFPKIKTRRDLEDEYLNQAKSLTDLEHRMCQIDREKAGKTYSGL